MGGVIIIIIIIIKNLYTGFIHFSVIYIVINMCPVDLADMLISIYRIPCRTKRWYVKIFWHLVDLAKVNAWILYRRHLQQRQERAPSKSDKSKTLLEFSSEIADKI
jgi:hypothetical protein